MATTVFMILFIISVLIIWTWGISLSDVNTSAALLTKKESTTLRGLFCIVVMIAHIPEAYQNRIQDMITSFGFVAVTFFFLTAAYGLRLKVNDSPDYMNRFWRRRLPPILIPAILSQIIIFLYEKIAHASSGNILIAILNINDWCKVLLLCYLIFWAVYVLLPKIIRIPFAAQDITATLIITAFSLIGRLTDFKPTLIWIVEPLGFAYGLLAAAYSEKILAFLRSKATAKIVIFLISSLILGVSYLIFKPIEIWGDYLLKIILGIVILLFMFAVIKKVNIGNRTTAFIGGISYETFLLHEAVYTVIMDIDKTRSLNPGLFIWTGIVMTVILSRLLKLLSDICLKAFHNTRKQS